MSGKRVDNSLAFFQAGIWSKFISLIFKEEKGVGSRFSFPFSGTSLSN
jgi:hypothetical protein